MTSVPMLSPALANKEIMPELEKAAIRVLNSGQYILGKEVEDFENKCALYLGVKHAISVSSGTDALLCALMSLNIGPGDEVICPSFTFFATAGAIARVGATPVFVDVNEDCFTINIADVRDAITEKTKAVIPVHLFGQSADLRTLKEICGQKNIYIIEDVAQAFGASLEGKMLGSIGEIGCFSFFPSKNLGGFGDGGLVTTNDDDLARVIFAIRNHGSIERYYHFMIGANFRLDALQTALLNVKFSKENMEKIISKRILHATEYNASLNHRYNPPKQVRGLHTYNQYTIKLNSAEERKQLQEHLGIFNISSAVYYPLPLHKQQAFAYLPQKTLPVTEKLCERVLSLPISDEISDEQIRYVTNVVNQLILN
jgi:dTDP-4-amino-4,6-dideoxygalactose transaminase